MLNTRSLQAVDQSSFEGGLCKPLYSSYCFSNVSKTIEDLLLGGSFGLPPDCTRAGNYDTVILFFIDGFGFRLFEKYADRFPFLRRFLEEGIVSKITAQFPSTTAGHVTSLSTALTPSESGIYEWFQYEPTLRRVIAPLLFSFAGDKKPGGLPPTTPLYPEETVYQRLAKRSIPSFVYQQRAIANSVCSQNLFKGARLCGYPDLKVGLKLLSEGIKERGYHYFYCSDIDSKAHHHGLHSPKFEEVVERTFRLLEEFMTRQERKAAIILVSDHGLIEIDPKTTYYLNLEIPGLASLLRTGSNGAPLAPVGSCRDFFLHPQEGMKQQVKELVKAGLKERGDLYESEELILQGFFGPKVSQAFLQRVGELVILPRGNNSVWWYEEGKFEQKFFAMHGGLTRDEMETLFCFLF